MKTTIGGDRLGSGNKQNISMRNYERSTHDLSYIWRSSMSSGTLVPFMSEVGLPGDSFDIDLNCEVLTLPTNGPLFGSYKVQLDVFTAPVRLYQGKLHMNKLGVGMDMSGIKLPQMLVKAWSNGQEGTQGDNDQINPSSILSYLNIRGLGYSLDPDEVYRNFNALPYLSYWDIYKNYYANKQEEEGRVIHNTLVGQENYRISAAYASIAGEGKNVLSPNQASGEAPVLLLITLADGLGEPIIEDIEVIVNGKEYKLNEIFSTIKYTEETQTIKCENWLLEGTSFYIQVQNEPVGSTASTNYDGMPQIERFDLANIDEMREEILKAVQQESAFMINEDSIAPYGLPFKNMGSDAEGRHYSILSNQEGLGLKTYQSDLFNNWISTEWIDGTNGINEVTAVSTANDSFTIDSLNLAQKVYEMLNRIAISGGSYDDWLDAVYTHERARSTESPVYQGSLIKELAFQEVVSTATTEVTEKQPLGQLAGRGKMTDKRKGGKIKIKIDEPSYIMGIVSITPRIDYSQGNKWDTNLETMNDFHKPALDEIGYQDLITDQMAWFDTYVSGNGQYPQKQFASAGKQPAWINYMTNVNQVRGTFAEENNTMFMVLNRRYENGYKGIQDLTTYIDPTKFNHIFADTRLDAQNFWVQIKNDITARRKMSAKVIPNL